MNHTVLATSLVTIPFTLLGQRGYSYLRAKIESRIEDAWFVLAARQVDRETAAKFARCNAYAAKLEAKVADLEAQLAAKVEGSAADVKSAVETALTDLKADATQAAEDVKSAL